jgi:ribosomal protein L14
MIQQASSIIIKDNSGFLLAKCIMVKKTGNKSGVLGDSVKVAIKKAKMNRSNKSQKDKANTSMRSSLQTLVLIQTKKPVQRLDGSRIRFAQNAGVVVNEKNRKVQLGFKRVTTPLCFELKKKPQGQLNILKLARSLI